MEGNSDIQEFSKILIESVKLTLNPSSTHLQRQQAFEYIEKIKVDSRICLPCGFFLSSQEDPEVIHLGLQLLEESIRYHWNDLPIEQKILIKDNSMKLLTKGIDSISNEQIYIKDKISRLIVEMVKREWPQQWENLLEELREVSIVGPSQAELVLLVFLRLAEDVETLQKDNSYNRRRDIYAALNANMDFLFNLFFNLLETHYGSYRQLEQQSPSTAALHSRVTQVVYMTLGGFVEWVAMDHIMNYKGKLFTSICMLIHDKQIRQKAAECFLRIVSRKSDRKQLLILFDKIVMDAISSAARLSVMDKLSEENYLFLKTLFQVLTNLGLHLCYVWDKEPDFKEPETFSIYLNSVLSFMQHPSLTIFSYSNVLMLQLLKHPQAIKSPIFVDMVSNWIPIAFAKLKKTGYPSRTDSVESKYSALDFDDDTDYLLFFSQVTNFSFQTIRQAASMFPELCFTLAEQVFYKCISIPVTSQCSTTCQDDWNSITYIMDCVMPKILQCQSSTYTPPTDKVKLLLQKCLEYECENPKIIVHILSSILALCSFLPLIPEVKSDVVNKIFSCFRFPHSFSNFESKAESKPVFNLRNQACSTLVKLCKNYPKEMSSISSDFFNSYINNIPDLIPSERGMLLQSQLILINEIHNFDMMQNCIETLLVPYIQEWLTLSEAFSTTQNMIIFLGLDKTGCDDYTNRSKLWKCLVIFLSAMKNIKVPQDKSIAKEGGFLLAETENELAYRVPGSHLFISLLPSLFNLSRCLNSLALPEYQEFHSEEFSKAHEIPNAEIRNILNIHNQENNSDIAEDGTNLQKMKLYMKNVYSETCSILGEFGPLLGETFYSTSNLHQLVIQSIFSNLTSLPDFKIRCLVTGFYKRFILSCPQKFYESINLPVIYHATTIMLNHLNLRWAYVSSVIQSDTYNEEATDTKEVLDLSVIQILSREYIDIIKDQLVNKTKSLPNADQQSQEYDRNGIMDTADTQMDTTDDVAMNNGDSKLSSNPERLSPLGKLLIGCDPICQAIVVTLCNAVSWNDSISSYKANKILQLCLHSLFEEVQQNFNEEAINHIVVSVLKGIHVHGQDVHNLIPLIDTAIMLYERLASNFPIIKTTILSLPEASETIVQNFDDLLVELDRKSYMKNSNKDKIKRETFKKMIQGVIGKNISEAFQRKVLIKDLTPIFKKPRKKNYQLDEESNNLELCQLFGVTS